MRVARSFTLWCVAVVALALVVVVLNPRPVGDGARIAHLESLVRCPSCEDLSVAQSTATAALAVRAEIAARVRAGQSDNQILTSLERVYGTSILLRPPTSGLGVVLWLGPLLLVVALVVGALRLARRR